jgi:hypothetical protein
MKKSLFLLSLLTTATAFAELDTLSIAADKIKATIASLTESTQKISKEEAKQKLEAAVLGIPRVRNRPNMETLANTVEKAWELAHTEKNKFIVILEKTLPADTHTADLVTFSLPNPQILEKAKALEEIWRDLEKNPNDPAIRIEARNNWISFEKVKWIEIAGRKIEKTIHSIQIPESELQTLTGK